MTDLEKINDRLELELTIERTILLTVELMLSEMGISSAEKCQMAYDYLHAHRMEMENE